MTLRPDQNVASIFVSTLFYGLYLATLFHCLRWLIFTDDGWKLRKKISWTLVTITLLLFALSTTSRAILLQTTMVEVQNASKPPPHPPPGTIWNTTTLPWMSVVTCTDANVSTLLADAVLIHRTWIIYSKSRWVIAFPIFLWIGGLLLTILQAYWQIVQSASILKAWRPVNMKVGPGTILMPFWLSTIILNGYSTFMIVRRIHLVVKQSESSPLISQFQLAMRISIESGALYLTVAIAHFVSWWTPNAFAISIISGINLSVTGIAFNLIVIRVAQRRAEDSSQVADSKPTSALQFNIAQSKPPIDELEIDAMEEIVFRPHPYNSQLTTESATASVV